MPRSRMKVSLELLERIFCLPEEIEIVAFKPFDPFDPGVIDFIIEGAKVPEADYVVAEYERIKSEAVRFKGFQTFGPLGAGNEDAGP